MNKPIDLANILTSSAIISVEAIPDGDAFANIKLYLDDNRIIELNSEWYNDGTSGISAVIKEKNHEKQKLNVHRLK